MMGNSAMSVICGECSSPRGGVPRYAAEGCPETVACQAEVSMSVPTAES